MFKILTDNCSSRSHIEICEEEKDLSQGLLGTEVGPCSILTIFA